MTDETPAAGFSHEAFFYSEPAEFLEGAVAFVREGLALDQSVLVAVPGPRAGWLRDFFSTERDVTLVDMTELGANPARIIPAWGQFLRANLDRGREVRGIGEPVWSGRSPAEIAECQQHESLLNVAFDQGPAWRLLCPYDAAALPGEVIDQARATHPVLVAGGELAESPTYHRVPGSRALRGQPLPPPVETPVEMAFSAGDLASVRRIVGRRCAELGLPETVTDDLVLSVDEVASNSLLHGGGRGVLRVWREADSLVCEVSDDGTIEDPLVGRQVPPLDRLGGRGIWLANQLCDLVQVRSGAAGTVVRLHARLP